MILKNLQVGYGKKSIGPNLNLEIPQGKFIVILGRNGIGKSSLIRTLAGVQSAIGGSIELNNQNLSELTVRTRAKQIGLVLTNKVPMTQYTVRDFVAMGRYPYTNWLNKLNKEDIDIIDKSLAQIGALELANRQISKLSDGEQQKVQIAKVLAQSCSFILLDEPTAHLDMHHKIQLFNLLKEQVINENKTIIMASHEVNLSLQLADDLWVLLGDESHYGPNKELIEKKVVQQLFKDELIRFDENLGQFILASS
ncbi:ABC transporter ATP-binding protein [Flavobacteriaceae bacterium]|nr:ABC transporter ATP-binding protein [Flavobacteriaceae bacterium]